METPAEVIKRYRDAVPLTQAEVAGALGITEGAVWQWERGRTHPSRARAIRLDRLLGASGALVAALGYRLPEDNEAEVTRLRAEVGSQGKRLDDLAALVSELTDAVAELRRGQGRRRREQ